MHGYHQPRPPPSEKGDGKKEKGLRQRMKNKVLGNSSPDESRGSREGEPRSPNSSRPRLPQVPDRTWDWERLSKLPPEELKKLPSEVLSRLPTETHLRLPTESLNTLEPQALAALGRTEPSRLLRLSPNKFFQVLGTDPQLLSLYSASDMMRFYDEDLIRLPHDALIKWLDPPLLNRLLKHQGDEFRQLQLMMDRKIPMNPRTPIDARAQMESRSSNEPPHAFLADPSTFSPFNNDSVYPSSGSPYLSSTPIASLSSSAVVPGSGDAVPRPPGSTSSRPPLSHAGRPSNPNHPHPGQSRVRGRSLSRSNSIPASGLDDNRTLPYRPGYTDRPVISPGSPELRVRESGSNNYRQSREFTSAMDLATSYSPRFQDGIGDEIAKLKAEIQAHIRDRDALSQEIGGLRTEIKFHKDDIARRISDVLRNKNARLPTENDDPVEVITRYTEQFYNEADHNYKVAVDHQRLASEAQATLHTLRDQLSVAQNDIQSLRGSERHLREQLQRQEKQVQGSSYLMEKCRMLQAKVDNLLSTIDDRVAGETSELRARVAELESEKNTYGIKFQENQRWYDTQVAQLKTKHEADLLEKESQCTAKIRAEETRLEEKLTRTRTDFENALRERSAQYEQNVSELKNTVKSLRGSLVDNSDDFRPATDDALKQKYLKLKLAIHTVTYHVSATSLHRTGTGFSGQGEGMEHFLLQSRVWETVMEGFFSEPYGFGALGPGTGRQKLLGLFQAWKDTFEIEPNPGKSLAPLAIELPILTGL